MPFPHLPALLALATKAGSAAHGHSSHVPHWLIHLGVPGLFVVSLLDAAIIPLPLPGSGDVLLLLLCAQKGSHPVFVAATAIIASVLGGYTTWATGRKGGESMLRHFVPKRMIEPVTRWMRGHGFATVAVSAIMPPPVPLMPMLLGAGALGASRMQFLSAFTLARGLRYSIVAWIGATYGRHVLREWNQYLAEWSSVILFTFFGLLVAALAVGIWQYRRQKASWDAELAQEKAGKASQSRHGVESGPGSRPEAEPTA